MYMLHQSIPVFIIIYVYHDGDCKTEKSLTAIHGVYVLVFSLQLPRLPMPQHIKEMQRDLKAQEEIVNMYREQRKVQNHIFIISSFSPF